MLRMERKPSVSLGDAHLVAMPARNNYSQALAEQPDDLLGRHAVHCVGAEA
jgi:hypothetical protein